MNIYALLIIIVGGINLYFITRFIKDEKFARRYIRTSPKAYLWRKKFGEEKAYQIVKKIFVPIGFIVSCLFVIAGIFFLGTAF